ncbi:GMC family oxidoreductase N-terminal domain-containing protein [Mycobacterium sp. 141]|uniref:GMC family oxidoreductase N-terminal domain-containing protein n=1 Tax=Mycobacterium sp. 141 TaxID=1120797 RepID=UPI0004778413
MPDFNGSDADAALRAGVGAVPLNIDGGTRPGSAVRTCQPARHRDNLEGRAVGAGRMGGEILAADRIILCGRAIGSVQLLILSGIGPAADLERLGIAVVAGLPVGTSTVDHPEWVPPVGWPPTHDRPPVEVVLTTAGASRSGVHRRVRRQGPRARSCSSRAAAPRDGAHAAAYGWRRLIRQLHRSSCTAPTPGQKMWWRCATELL